MARRARTVVGTIACVAAWLQPLAIAKAADDTRQHDLQIERQPLARALQEFAKQSGVQIIFFSAVTEGREAPSLRGRFTTEAALKQLLDDSRLTFREISPNTIEICLRTPAAPSNKAAPQRGPVPEREMKEEASGNLRLAEAREGSSWLRRFMGAIFSAAAASAGAQTDTPIAALEEVIVTAQKRAETVQSIPIAVTALSGEKLASQGVQSVLDLSAQAPNLQITNGGSNRAQVFLRGVGSTNTTVVGDPAVAVHIDDVYISRSTGLGALFYDIDRVEVVRGPQGTLYGRNATAGAINIITKRPTQAFEGAASLEFGNYNTLVTSGMLNLPASDSLAMRAAFQISRHDGYLETANSAPNNGDGNDRNDQDDIAGRLQMLYEPNEQFSLLLRGDYLHQGGAGQADVAYPLETGDPYTALPRVDISQDNTYWSGGAQASYDFGFSTVTYVGGYRSESISLVNENMASDNHRPQYLNQEVQTASHELRLNGDTDRFDWVLGLYRFTEDMETDFRLQLANGNYLGFLMPDISADSSAAFLQATYSLTDSLRFTGGVRYTEDDKARSGNTFILSPAGAVIALVTQNLSDNSWESTDWKLGVDFDLTPDSMLYAQVATAYKAGGYFDGLPPNSYDPEEIKAYEVGSKNTFLANTLLFNVAAFYNDYSDLQVSAVETIAGQAALVTRNAGKAEIYGVELESSFRITADDTFDLTASWLHARYDEFLLPLGDPFVNNNANANVERCYDADYTAPAPRAGDFSGCRMARAPEVSVTAAYSHVWGLPNGAMLTGRIQSHYESETDLEFHGFATNKQDAYTKTDVSLTYTVADERWSVMAYVRNVEDETVATNSNSNAQTGASAIGTRFYAPPRLYGVRFSAKFE